MSFTSYRFRPLGGTFLVLFAAILGAPDVGTASTPVQVLAAGQVDNGNLLDRQARLDVHDVSLEAALTALRNQSGVSIAFSVNFLPSERQVSCRCWQLAVRDALGLLLEGTSLTYAELRTQIVIEPKAEEELWRPARDIAVLASATPNVAPMPVRRIAKSAVAPILRQDVVAGIVQDAMTGEPVRGAQVSIDGTGRGTLTDNQGRFRFEGIPGPEVTLRIQFIGYRTLVATAETGATDLRFALEHTAIHLDEVVVTGTPSGTRRRALGNVVTRIDAEQVSQVAPIPDLAAMINARAPGVLVESASGTVGGGSRIRIRGHSSFSLSDQPLLYVDGVRVNNTTSVGSFGSQRRSVGSSPLSRMNDIDPNDIERVEIIKGPAASTLYGTEASNGVIQIFTKRGRSATRAQFDMSVRQGAAWFHNYENRFHPNWYRDENGQMQAFNISRIEREAGRPIFRTGHQQGVALGVRGGSDVINYYVSASYDHDDGIEPTNKVRRIRTRANLGFQPTSTINVVTSLGIVTSTIDQHLENSGVWFATRFANPALLDTPLRGFTSRPPETVWRSFRDWEDLRRVTGSFQVNHSPVGWLSQRATVGFDMAQGRENRLERFMNEFDRQFYSAAVAQGRKEVQTRNDEFVTIDYGATATFSLSEALVSATSGGFQYHKRDGHRSRATGLGFPSIGLDVVDATATTTGREWSLQDISAGFYVQQHFGWQDRIFVTAAVRGDDHSAFGEDFTVAYYPKASLSWVVSEEPWWNVPALGNMRLRAAYGHSGKSPNSFDALRTYEPITTGFGTAALSPSAQGNTELGPERGVELEVGFEASAFDERIGVDVTYYSRRTRDAILSRQTAPSLGFGSNQLVNAGEIFNHGVELQIFATPVRRRNVDFGMNFNLSLSDNEVVDLAGEEVINNGNIQHRPGFPLASWFREKVVSAEIDENGRAFNIMCDGGTGRHGVEQGGAPVPCDEAPRVFIGVAEPTVEGSVSSTLTLFNRLTLFGMVDFKYGHKASSLEFGSRCVTRTFCWENHHPHDFPIFTAEVQETSIFPTNYRIRDTGFTRLRELSASYRLPDAWASSIGADRASIRVAGRNLHTWTKWIGLDPETFHMSDRFNREEQDVMPLLHQFNVTLNVTF